MDERRRSGRIYNRLVIDSDDDDEQVRAMGRRYRRGNDRQQQRRSSPTGRTQTDRGGARYQRRPEQFEGERRQRSRSNHRMENRTNREERPRRHRSQPRAVEPDEPTAMRRSDVRRFSDRRPRRQQRNIPDRYTQAVEIDDNCPTCHQELPPAIDGYSPQCSQCSPFVVLDATSFERTGSGRRPRETISRGATESRPTVETETGQINGQTEPEPQTPAFVRSGSGRTSRGGRARGSARQRERAIIENSHEETVEVPQNNVDGDETVERRTNDRSAVAQTARGENVQPLEPTSNYDYFVQEISEYFDDSNANQDPIPQIINRPQQTLQPSTVPSVHETRNHQPQVQYPEELVAPTVPIAIEESPRDLEPQVQIITSAIPSRTTASDVVRTNYGTIPTVALPPMSSRSKPISVWAKPTEVQCDSLSVGATDNPFDDNANQYLVRAVPSETTGLDDGSEKNHGCWNTRQWYTFGYIGITAVGLVIALGMIFGALINDYGATARQVLIYFGSFIVIMTFVGDGLLYYRQTKGPLKCYRCKCHEI